MTKSIIGMMISFLLLLPKCEEPHDHQGRRIYFANGLKSSMVITCGDTSQVLRSGRHIPIGEERMEILGIEKPE